MSHINLPSIAARCPDCGLYITGYGPCLCKMTQPPRDLMPDYPTVEYDDPTYPDTGCYPITPQELMKTDKRLSELEDKVRILEEALEESEAELMYKEAQLALALEIANKAHDLRVQYENNLPYKDQPLLPFGDVPE